MLIIGCGFGGLEAAKTLRHAAVDITLVDKANHHLFQPLLYQVATAGLSAPSIASPARSLSCGQRYLTTLLGEIVRVDPAARQVVLADGNLATIGRHSAVVDLDTPLGPLRFSGLPGLAVLAVRACLLPDRFQESPGRAGRLGLGLLDARAPCAGGQRSESAGLTGAGLPPVAA
ncbi:MAG: FAD-dependent oxidoreductase [Inhella sp.]